MGEGEGEGDTMNGAAALTGCLLQDIGDVWPPARVLTVVRNALPGTESMPPFPGLGRGMLANTQGVALG